MYMNESDIEVLAQIEEHDSTSDKSFFKFGPTPLPDKRITLTDEEMNAMGAFLVGQMGSDVRPSSPEEASSGVGGYKLDYGKARWELAPFDAFEAMVNVLTWAVDQKARGQDAYPERNWERGMSWSRCFGAMMRHSWRWWMGKMSGRSTIDEESGMSHLWHAFTCAGFLVAYELRKMNKFDDRPTVESDR